MVRAKLAGGLLAGLLVILIVITPPSHGDGLSLEQVLSAPFPSDLVAAPRGDKVAWVFNAKGVRNLWVASAPSFTGKQVTHFDKDDGQEIAEPVFSPNGELLAYVYGGPKNQDGESPSPTTDSSGARQEVRVVNLRTGSETTLGEGNSPFFTPAGGQVIYLREDHFWITPARGGKESKLFEMRGRVASPVWSPGGTLLAFVSSRSEHSFVSIYDFKSKQIRLLDPSADRDIEPRWSEDGKQIAFIRLLNVADSFSADKERLAPWSIRVVEVESGKGREVWRSGTTEADSFPNYPDRPILEWAPAGRLVFASEQDGWRHLYSVSAGGGSVTALTPGNYEVESVAWSPGHSFLVAATNAGDIDRRHLWRVAAAGGLAHAITSGESIEHYPVVVDGGKRVAFLHSTARAPLQPVIASTEGGQQLAPLADAALPADFPASQLVTPEQVTFKAPDGSEIHGQLFRPKNGSGRMPAMIFTHGGPPRQMLLGWHYMYYYHNSYAMNQYLASRGYLVLSVNYRSGIGYGREFREAKQRGPRGASEYQDVVAGAKYLQSRDDVDPKRIGLWGGSYGGFLTAMGLARNSDLFTAGVDLHGVHDWTAIVGRGPWASGSPELVKLGKESSPVASVESWKSPVLLIQGDDDRNVNFLQMILLIRQLRKHSVPFEQVVFPDEVHDFLRHSTWLKAYGAAADFLDRQLRGRPMPISPGAH